MDEEMWEAWKGDFFEIDLDYEFEASKYFDFSREESYAERSEAELWFQTAKSYPPCPLIRKLILGIDEVVGKVNILPKFKDTENPNSGYAHSITGSGSEFSAINESHKGWTVQYNIVEDDCRENKKFTKGRFTKGSTLMKPTASQLAKQNRSREVIHKQFVHRLPKPYAQTCKETVEDSSENAGVKRQKLEGGRLKKVVGVKEQRDLLHKAPQKKILPVDVTSQHSRLRITIPREPELETAQRAQRPRSQRSSVARQPQEEGRPTTSVFRARPLNRKILEAPSLPLPQKSTPRLPQFQAFTLKTEERALQHSSCHSSSWVAKDASIVSTAQVNAPGLRKFRRQLSARSQLQNNDKQDECDAVHPMFKAQPLNKKILSSKGDFGVFKSTKREITKPKEFNFSMDKRCQQDPPTDLFNKLSLHNEAQKTSASQTRSMLWPFDEASKGSKENIDYTAQQGQKDVHVKKEELIRHGINHVKSEVSLLPNHSPQTSKLAVTQAFGDHNGI